MQTRFATGPTLGPTLGCGRHGSQNINAEYRYTIYATPSSPVPVIRNEELGLPLAALPTGAPGLDLIMYEKHLSHLFEGTRWVDMRRWGRLGLLPIDRAGQFVAKGMPIPPTRPPSFSAPLKR